MIKNANEIIEETDEDLQLQAGMQLTSDERQCLFGPRIKSVQVK